MEGRAVSIYESFRDMNVNLDYSCGEDAVVKLQCLNLAVELVKLDLIKLDQVNDQAQSFLDFIKS